MESNPAAVHLDLDGGEQVFRAHGWKYEAASDALFETGLRGALDFFDEAGLRATLFVVADDLADPRKRKLIADAVRRGHDIASHSVTHRQLTALDRGEKWREISESRERLAQSLGVEIAGFRAPGFAIDRESLQMIADAGYQYDSSLFPATDLASRAGFAAVSASPQRPLTDSPLVELPMPAYRPLPFPFHPCYSLVLGVWYFRLGLRLFRRTRAPLVLLFHLTDFADPLPQSALPHRLAGMYTLSHLSSGAKRRRCRQMLKIVAGEYQLGPTHMLLSLARK